MAYFGVQWRDEAKLAKASAILSRYERMLAVPDDAVNVETAALKDWLDWCNRVAIGYWGGMRDRMPASQTDAMTASGVRTIINSFPRRRTVISHDGVALIRSGQDWSDVIGEELVLYRDRIEPVLCRGMMFLREEGLDIGCYFNRYMTLSTDNGGKDCRTLGMSAWRDLAEMEARAEHHPTHKAISCKSCRR
ncbi:hypothetical protein BAR24_14870 [Gluconobacter oxydans]|nr:phenylacetaldoxime dehydratase family protein [Gluconobacter thailandicus]AFW01779.1 phenylacetaldoxime dehydratase [Gluconobacter oxydans H24]ANQ42621.1 hypothetical protein BAR24_14870 [Gluconobacter oxydans]